MMNQFKVQFFFVNIDNSLYTKEQAALTLDLQADDDSTLHHLCRHLVKVYSADHYTILE